MSLWATTRFQMDQSSKKANRPNLNDIGFFSTSKRHCAWEAKGIAPTKGLLYTKLFDGLLLPTTVNNTEFIATQAPDRSGHTFICCSMYARIKITIPGSSQNSIFKINETLITVPWYFIGYWDILRNQSPEGRILTNRLWMIKSVFLFPTCQVRVVRF